MSISVSRANTDPARLFIIEGIVTIGVAIVCIWLLPDEPLTTKWLSPEQRQLAHDRIQRDTVGLESSKGVKAGFMQALRDPRLYLLVFMQNMHLSATSFNQVSSASLSPKALPTITQVFSNCRLVARFQHDNYSGPHCTAFARGGCHRHLRWYFVWQVQRSNMAHHRHDGDCDGRVRYQRRHS